jgi:hypothetical protein
MGKCTQAPEIFGGGVAKMHRISLALEAIRGEVDDYSTFVISEGPSRMMRTEGVEATTATDLAAVLDEGLTELRRHAGRLDATVGKAIRMLETSIAEVEYARKIDGR